MELPVHQGPIAFWRVVRAESREMSFVHAFLHGCGKFPSCRIEKSSTLHKMYRPAGTSALRVAIEGTCHFFLSCHRDTLNSSIVNIRPLHCAIKCPMSLCGGGELNLSIMSLITSAQRLVYLSQRDDGVVKHGRDAEGLQVLRESN